MPAHLHTSFSIRHASPEEAHSIRQFIQAHSQGYFQLSGASFVHHIQTIFLAQDEQGNLAGALVSWQSPSVYNTAVIEALVMDPQWLGSGAASLLLQHCLAYWQTQCVHVIHAFYPALVPAYRQWFERRGFEQVNWQGIGLLRMRQMPDRICLHNKKMRPRLNTENGQIDENTLFHYYQFGDYIWGTYSGGAVVRGMLIGRMAPNRNLRFHYMQMDTHGQVHTGTSHSTTEFTNDGRIVLYEDWEWTGNRSGSGTSIIEEVKE